MVVRKSLKNNKVNKKKLSRKSLKKNKRLRKILKPRVGGRSQNISQRGCNEFNGKEDGCKNKDGCKYKEGTCISIYLPYFH